MARREIYPEVARGHLEAERPGLRASLATDEFYHPADLGRHVARAANRRRPDLVVIDVGAFFLASGPGAIDLSAFPRRIQMAYDRARHLRGASLRLLAAFPLGFQLVRLIETSATALATGALRPVVRRYPRPSVEEYEGLLRSSIRHLTANPEQRVILQGPGGFNHDEPNPQYSPRTPEIYDEVNSMAKRVAAAHSILFVDRIAVAGGMDPSLFLPGSSRFSVAGHRVMGHALAEAILGSGLL